MLRLRLFGVALSGAALIAAVLLLEGADGSGPLHTARAAPKPAQSKPGAEPKSSCARFHKTQSSTKQPCLERRKFPKQTQPKPKHIPSLGQAQPANPQWAHAKRNTVQAKLKAKPKPTTSTPNLQTTDPKRAQSKPNLAPNIQQASPNQSKSQSSQRGMQNPKQANRTEGHVKQASRKQYPCTRRFCCLGYDGGRIPGHLTSVCTHAHAPATTPPGRANAIDPRVAWQWCPQKCGTQPGKMH